MNTQGSKEQRFHSGGRYVLMTAAYNEEANIEGTIRSVLAQTQLPNKWVIVSDGSFDRTDAIVQKYADEHDFIHLVRVERSPGRSFRSKVIALRKASELMTGCAFDFIGNLDADISIACNYFEDLIARFNRDHTLGLAGGFVCEKVGEIYRSRRINRRFSVAHAAQLIRRECYEAIGGYAVLKYGGEDWHAQISVRMLGWKAEAFPDLQIFHHRATGEADNALRHALRLGKLDYSFGSDPLFEIIKCFLFSRETPLLLSGILRLTGFFSCYVAQDERAISSKMMAFLRKEQRQRIRSLINRRLNPAKTAYFVGPKNAERPAPTLQ